MKKHSFISAARPCILLIVVLAFWLYGCGPAPEGSSVETVAAKAITAGDVDRGRDLFMGYAHFENEGPPCMGCHSVGENGLLGGGSMGPDLTNIYSQRSQTEILAVLSNTGRKISPVMRPIYMDHPLTWDEQVDLLAFLETSVGQPEADRELLVLGISIAGFLGAVGVLGFVYRSRLRSVRRALVNKAQKESR
ncbi:MAG TPA: cytochrome c [Anaerolineales bacterium]|nr:cytochrome c [Anaerolineales bacterium]